MNWWLAGLLAGVAAWLVDYVMWGKVFTKGMDAFATLPPDGVKMGPMLAKSLALSLVFGLLLAYFYLRFNVDLWAGRGIMGGMEFGTVLWLPTIALSTIGSGVWYDKVRPLLMATFWAWLARSIVAGAVVGLLIK